MGMLSECKKLPPKTSEGLGVNTACIQPEGIISVSPAFSTTLGTPERKKKKTVAKQTKAPTGDDGKGERQEHVTDFLEERHDGRRGGVRRAEHNFA